MGFQPDTGAVVVKATLTDLGTKYLLTDPDLFQIDRFRLFDDEIDYTLWNTTHPNGTTFYGTALEGLPVLEPVKNSAFQLRYELIIDFERDTRRGGFWEQSPKNIDHDGITFSDLNERRRLWLKLHNVHATDIRVSVANSNLVMVDMEGAVDYQLSPYAADDLIPGNSSGNQYYVPKGWTAPMKNQEIWMELSAGINDSAENKTTLVSIKDVNNGTVMSIPVTVEPNSKLDVFAK